MPPLMGSTAPSTGMDANAAGNSVPGQDGARQQLEQIMGKIRDLGQQFEDLGSQVPSLSSEVQQIKQILKRMVVKAAQQAPQQTASSSALPSGG